MFREEIEKPMIPNDKLSSFTSVRNACKLCSPLGASLVLKGIRGCIPMLHGSQGCATYIRRYLISHFKEPVDIASSNFSEESTVFGGSKNFCIGIDNVISQYHPEVIGIATTCLSETIGEDVASLIKAYCTQNKGKKLPHFVHVSTPSYRGTHMDGFHETVLSVVRSLASFKFKGNHVNLFPGFVSPADMRHLKEVLNCFVNRYIMLPDYSETLDGTNWKEYQLISAGGTPADDLAYAGSAKATIELGAAMYKGTTAGKWLSDQYGVTHHLLPLPIGIKQTDRFFKILEMISASETPNVFRDQRGRLVDSYVDGHKYVFGKKVIVYGEEDFVLAMVAFLSEIGIKTVLAGSGADSHCLKDHERIGF
jgi:nitrogenase molybdenum-iron protein NifN